MTAQQPGEKVMERLQGLIDIWSMRPPPDSPEGLAWEYGARQGWEWALEECRNIALAIDSGRGNEKEIAKAIASLSSPSKEGE